jgi:hypothetical protein
VVLPKHRLTADLRKRRQVTVKQRVSLLDRHLPRNRWARGVGNVVRRSGELRGQRMTLAKEQAMSVNEQVGNAAGEVWRLLDHGGMHSLTQLKKKFSGTGELLGFAVGWLAREDKLRFPRKRDLSC